MTRKAVALRPAWDDRESHDEDTPAWTDDQLDRADLAVGGKVVRSANGTLTRAGRPPLGEAAKQQVTLRLDPDVLAKFREGGPVWQRRIDAALRTAVGLGRNDQKSRNLGSRTVADPREFIKRCLAQAPKAASRRVITIDFRKKLF